MTTTTPTQQISTALGNLHVRTEGTGPDALLWHGMFVDGTSWNRVAPSLLTKRTLHIIDGPGHGRSQTLDRIATVEECAGVARDVMDKLDIDGPVDWVGNAWGGHVGMAVATNYPARVRSLIAISSPPRQISPELRRKITLLRPLLRTFGYRGPLLNAVLASQLSPDSVSDEILRGEVVTAMRRADPKGIARAIQSFILNRADVSANLQALAAPTLFIASDDRGEFTAEDARRAAEATPRGSWSVARDARALIPLEQPEWLAQRIVRFWEAVPA